MSEEEKEKWENLYREVGRFLLLFAQIEAHLISTARILTNAPPQFLLDLAGSWRIDVGTRSLLNLLETLQYSEELKNDLTRALKQLAQINNLRNALLHSITAPSPNPGLAVILGEPADYDFGGGDFLATNVQHARGDKNIRIFPLSVEILRGAHNDLELIMEYLFRCENRILDIRHPERAVPPDAQAKLEALRSKAWSWKMPQQGGWQFAKTLKPE